MHRKAVPSPDTPPRQFPEHLLTALQQLRAAILETLLAVDAEPAKPQELARRFDLNKNLTWKISKVVGAADPYEAVPHIPGAAGLRIFLRALQNGGAPAALVEEASRAAREFDRVVKVHTGDRDTLDIMVGGLLPAAQQHEQIAQSRKLAYRGNSGTLGVRAKAQLMLAVLAPNEADPDRADLVQVGGLVGLRRLRPDVRWLLFRRERWDDDGPHPARDEVEPLDPAFSSGVPLLGDFCSKPIPDIDFVAGASEDQYELPPGPVGNTAAFTCIYGQVSRRVGDAFARSEGEYSEIGCNVITPAERLGVDLLVHRSYEWAMEPELVMYSRLDGGAIHPTARRDRNVLPVTERVNDLGWGITALATPILPTYGTLARMVFDRMGWDPEEFRALRFSMAYPPIPAVALLRSALPVR
ncbi:MAG: hypothetical protein HKO59_04260 [Phycisphaerales bacterium]|nr:hypothetical protein [Phycisphaerae bacterium]NNM25190.1 hypothetical protein [Phycisphaerales bacterium]